MKGSGGFSFAGRGPVRGAGLRLGLPNGAAKGKNIFTTHSNQITKIDTHRRLNSWYSSHLIAMHLLQCLSLLNIAHSVPCILRGKYPREYLMLSLQELMHFKSISLQQCFFSVAISLMSNATNKKKTLPVLRLPAFVFKKEASNYIWFY